VSVTSALTLRDDDRLLREIDDTLDALRGAAGQTTRFARNIRTLT
jgi:hypothetical protein